MTGAASPSLSSICHRKWGIMPDKQEWAGARLVAGSLRGSIVRTDLQGPGSTDRTPDFAIHVDGGVIALEVVTTTNGNVAAMHDAAAKSPWVSKKLMGMWSVTLPRPEPYGPAPRIRKVAAQLHDDLPIIEQQRVYEFQVETPPSNASEEVRAAITRLGRVGVIDGMRLHDAPNGQPGGVALSYLGTGSTHHTGLANQRAEWAACKKVHTLGHVEADERHVFIWVPSTDPDLQAGLLLGPTPSDGPALPDGVDTVWMAPWLPGPTIPTSVVWRAKRSSGWEKVAHRWTAGDG